MKRATKKQSLEELQEIWYKKLKNEGFEDIEKNETMMKQWSNIFYKKYNHEVYKGKEDYYYYATHFLNSHKFKRELERVIWEYHANGISVRDIAKTLNATKVLRTNRDSVWKILSALRKIMFDLYGIKSQGN